MLTPEKDRCFGIFASKSTIAIGESGFASFAFNAHQQLFAADLQAVTCLLIEPLLEWFVFVSKRLLDPLQQEGLLFFRRKVPRNF